MKNLLCDTYLTFGNLNDVAIIIPHLSSICECFRFFSGILACQVQQNVRSCTVILVTVGSSTKMSNSDSKVLQFSATLLSKDKDPGLRKASIILPLNQILKNCFQSFDLATIADESCKWATTALNHFQFIKWFSTYLLAGCHFWHHAEQAFMHTETWNSPRSYIVISEGADYVWNIQHLLPVSEPRPQYSQQDSYTTGLQYPPVGDRGPYNWRSEAANCASPVHGRLSFTAFYTAATKQPTCGYSAWLSTAFTCTTMLLGVWIYFS